MKNILIICVALAAYCHAQIPGQDTEEQSLAQVESQGAKKCRGHMTEECCGSHFEAQLTMEELQSQYEADPTIGEFKMWVKRANKRNRPRVRIYYHHVDDSLACDCYYVEQEGILQE